VEVPRTSRRAWWLGFWQTAEHVHWWLSPDEPGGTEPPEVGTIPRDRLTGPLTALESALPGLTPGERASLADVDQRLARTVLPATSVPGVGDVVESTATAIADRIELLARRAALLDGAARRAWSGAMVDPAANLALFRELGALLLPTALRSRLERSEPGSTTIVIAPGPGLSTVPWNCWSSTTAT